MTLMQKAEKRNEKRKAVKQNRFETSKADWRNVKLVERHEDSSDTEDEDDRDEIQKFMSLMEGAKQKKSEVDGKIHSRSPLPGSGAGDSQRMVKLCRDDSSCQSKEDLVLRRKEEFRERMLANTGGIVAGQSKARGKRKFSERMTLSEAAVEDFDNSQDYVHFLQDKLQGIKIKLVK